MSRGHSCAEGKKNILRFQVEGWRGSQSSGFTAKLSPGGGSERSLAERQAGAVHTSEMNHIRGEFGCQEACACLPPPHSPFCLHQGGFAPQAPGGGCRNQKRGVGIQGREFKILQASAQVSHPLGGLMDPLKHNSSPLGSHSTADPYGNITPYASFSE